MKGFLRSKLPPALGVLYLIALVAVCWYWPGVIKHVQPANASASAIKHIVFIIKENHTFDNYFGAFTCGGNPSCVNGTTTGQVSGKGAVQTIPLNAFQDAPPDYAHGWGNVKQAYDNGRMDHFNVSSCTAVPYPCYQQAGPKDLPNYWTLAKNYVLDDNAFSSLAGPSFPNHLYTLSGASGPDTKHSAIANPTNGNQRWGCDSPSLSRVQLYNGSKVFPCFSFPNLADEMTAAGVSWKYYSPQVGESGYVWNSLHAYSQDLTNPNDVPWQQFATDAARGKLPAVAGSLHRGHRVSILAPMGISIACVREKTGRLLKFRPL